MKFGLGDTSEKKMEGKAFIFFCKILTFVHQLCTYNTQSYLIIAEGSKSKY